MREPIKSGDQCLVVGGMTNRKSPNLGLTVSVRELRGDHSRLGRVWRCYGEQVCQMNDTGDFIVMGWADFPEAWLQKIEPDQASSSVETSRLVYAS